MMENIDNGKVIQIKYDDKINNTITSNKDSESWYSNYWFSYPPDSGYAWIALMSGFVIVTLFTSTGPMFGLLFDHKIRSLKMTSLNITLAFNCLSFVWNMVITMSGPLNLEFGWRKVGMIAAFLCSLSIFVTGYTTSKVGIYFSFSLLSGMGGGLAFSTCLFVVAKYFQRLRGLAMAILGSGIGVGQLILPLFIRYLQEMYGPRGAAFIYSAFLLHGVIAAAFFHPLEWHKEKQAKRDLTSQPQKYLKEVVTETANEDLNTDITGCSFYAAEMCTSFIRISKKVLQLSANNVMNLRSPVVAILALSGASKMFCFLNIMLMLPLSVVAKGLTLQDSAYCFSIIGLSSVFSRVVIPTLSDLKGVNSTSCYIMGELLVAVSCLAYTFVSDFSYVALCFGILGAGMGASMGLHPIVLIEYKGAEELPQTYGSYGFVSALLFVIVGPIVGYIRDITGSYHLMYRIFSGILTFAAAVWVLMPCAVRYERKIKDSAEECTVTKL